jgi:uncharacterized membrane-anchored protein
MTPSRAETSLPAADALREQLHNEVHARPTANIRLPALLVYVAVLNEGVTRADELAQLRRLPGLSDLQEAALSTNFLRTDLGAPAGQATLQWERHSEFTRYALMLPLGERSSADAPALPEGAALDRAWLAGVPGRCFAAIEMVLLHAPLDEPAATLEQARRWFGDEPVVASLLGGGHSCAATDFRLRKDGFERMLVLAPVGTTPARAGRIAARLLELETYRLMALRGLPVAKSLAAFIGRAERGLSDITASLESPRESDPVLLERLVTLAVGVERATAEHMYRFSATRAYRDLVRERIAELREKPIPGTPTISEFMQRRFSPAMATVESTAVRLASLSQRVERAGALLRTRVDIAREQQNQQLLTKLAEGQALQLRLQHTVEGLSIAAISYYVVSLVLYGAKGGKALGLPLEPELLAGVTVPLALWGVWRLTRRARKQGEAPPAPPRR